MFLEGNNKFVTRKLLHESTSSQGELSCVTIASKYIRYIKDFGIICKDIDDTNASREERQMIDYCKLFPPVWTFKEEVRVDIGF